MDTAFFLLAKLFGLALRAENWTLLAMALTLLRLWQGRYRAALRTHVATVALVLMLGTLPFGELLIARIEAPNPARAVPERLQGIVVLGGYEDVRASLSTEYPQVNAAADRIIAAAILAKAHPEVRIVVSGGTARARPGKLEGNPVPDIGRTILTALGIAETRILWENRSRNTAENVQNTLALLGDVHDGKWLLVTSAFHMDRARSAFAAAGWPDIVPYPVDHRSGTTASQIQWNLLARIDVLNLALKEIVGAWGYRLFGRA